ncbi:MAG: hypothetical protein MUE69_34345 [Myxococcota bacterium]|nr:hypothetical protein [Myxococcota bacterium]
MRVEDATRSIRFVCHYHRCVLREEAGATLRFGYDTERSVVEWRARGWRVASEGARR